MKNTAFYIAKKETCFFLVCRREVDTGNVWTLRLAFRTVVLVNSEIHVTQLHVRWPTSWKHVRCRHTKSVISQYDADVADKTRFQRNWEEGR